MAEYLLGETRIDPLAKTEDGTHALMLALKDHENRDQGLPILELFHRKAPRALETPGRSGKDMRCCSRY